MSQPISTAQAVALLPVALIIGSIAYVVVGVENAPPLKYHYTIESEALPTATMGPFDTLELCEQDWTNMSVSLQNGGGRGLGHYELTGCAAIFNKPADNGD